MNLMETLKPIFRPLRSRKNRVALTATIVAIVAKMGLDWPNEVIYSGVTLASLVIVGIAIEDHGEKSNPTKMMTLQSKPSPSVGGNGQQL